MLKLRILFFTFLALLLAGLLTRQWVLASAALVSWVGLVAREYRRRLRPRFLAGNATGHRFREKPFLLAEHLFGLLVSGDGKFFLTVTLDGRARLQLENGGLVFDTMLEAKPLAMLLADDGRVFLALEKEIIGLDVQGKVFARLPFDPPEQGAQSYKIHLSADGGTLLLHTPWFVQWMKPDLSALGQRLTSREVGNFIKYLRLAPDGSFIFVGGALLLEEFVGVQARYACWARQPGGAYTLAWQKEDESQDNSHIRALELSRDGSRLLALVYRAGYEFTIFDREGNSLWQRQGEDPVLSPAGDLMLWHNPFEGLTLTQLEGRKKLWSRKAEAKVRIKQLNGDGTSLLLEGRHLLLIGRDGQVVSDDWFHTDPHDLALAEAGSLLAVVRQLNGALIRIS